MILEDMTEDMTLLRSRDVFNAFYSIFILILSNTLPDALTFFPQADDGRGIWEKLYFVAFYRLRFKK